MMTGESTPRWMRRRDGFSTVCAMVPTVRATSSHRRGIDSDWALAIALSSATAIGAAATGPPLLIARTAAVVVATGLLSLAGRRRNALAVLVIVLVVVIEEAAVASEAAAVPQFLAIIVATYSVAVHAETATVFLGATLGVAGVAAAHVVAPASGYSAVSSVVFFSTILVAGPMAVGRIVRSHTRLTGELVETTNQLQALRDERVARAVQTEQGRVGRQLEVIVLAALGGLRSWDQALDLVSVARVERVAREALAAMRAGLNELRTPPGHLGLPSDARQLHTQLSDAQALPPGPDHRDPDQPMPGRTSVLASRHAQTTMSAVAAVMTVAVLMRTWGRPDTAGVGALVLAAATSLPIAGLWRLPLEATALCVVSFLCYTATLSPTGSLVGLAPVTVVVICPLVVALRCPRRRAAAGLGLCLAGVAAALVVDPAHLVATKITPSIALVVAAWSGGRLVRAHRLLLHAAAATRVALEAEQQAEEAIAVAAERARVARDLHDALGHALTVVVMQATAARRAWGSDPPLAAEHARTLARSVREILDGLDPLAVSLLRAETPGYPLRQRLTSLVDDARLAGLRAHLEDDTVGLVLPQAVDQALFRIVQEALTNAARHAPGATVDVSLRRLDASIGVDIVNGEATESPAPGLGGGRGLEGMQERVLAVGGEMWAGPQPCGGFAVRARLPIPVQR